MTGHDPGRPTLRIYVAPGCAACRTALTLAEAVRHARPDHPIEVIDLADQPDAPLPPGVIGTPTYLLDRPSANDSPPPSASSPATPRPNPSG